MLPGMRTRKRLKDFTRKKIKKLFFSNDITKQRQLELRMKLLLGIEDALVTARSFTQQMFTRRLRCTGAAPGLGDVGTMKVSNFSEFTV